MGARAEQAVVAGVAEREAVVGRLVAEVARAVGRAEHRAEAGLARGGADAVDRRADDDPGRRRRGGAAEGDGRERGDPAAHALTPARCRGSRSLPAITSSARWRSFLGRKPDFMPKYVASGWWATIATVDCSGSSAWPPDRRRPICGASIRRKSFSCSDCSGTAG